MKPEYTRSVDLTADGRNLLGIAYKWESPSLVTDNRRDYYLEEFGRSADLKTLQQHPDPWPLMVMHGQVPLPAVGVVSFERSDAEQATLFQARLSKTSDADDMLELVNDGGMRSVSVRFLGYNSRKRSSIDGPVTTRLEIGIRELSLCPTGLGQHEGAEILAVRSTPNATPRRDALRRRRALLIRP